MDTLRRTLKYNGYNLKHAMNITDVGHLVSDGDEGEDKMVKAAKEEKKTPLEIVLKYLRELPTKDTPAEVGFLYYFGKTNDEDVTATLLDLIRRGYLELEYLGSPSEDDPNFIIKKNENKINSEENKLKAHEKQLIKWFIDVIGDKEKVNIQDIQNYGKSYSEATSFENEAKMFNDKILEEVIYTISLSVKDNFKVEEVSILVNDEEIYKNSLKSLEIQ